MNLPVSHFTPDSPELSQRMIQELTAGVAFEPGIGAQDLQYINRLGFLLTKGEGVEVGGMELVGFRASRNGLYDDRGFAAPQRDGELVSLDALQQRPDHAQLWLANQPAALGEAHTLAPGENEVELWGVTVPRRLQDLRFVRPDKPAGMTVDIKNRELGRKPLNRGDFRASSYFAAHGGQVQLHTVAVEHLGLPVAPYQAAVRLPRRFERTHDGNARPVEDMQPIALRKLGKLARG